MRNANVFMKGGKGNRSAEIYPGQRRFEKRLMIVLGTVFFGWIIFIISYLTSFR